ncbi:MAG: putative Ig domain-containing protein [Nitrospiraceae bacterium]
MRDVKGGLSVGAHHISRLAFVISEARSDTFILHILSTILITLFILSGCSPDPVQSGKATNRQPILRSAKIVPNPALRDKPVSVQVDVIDPDGDLITIRYQWRANANPIPGQTGSILVPTMLKRDDLLEVDLIPFDGKMEGLPYRTNAIPVGNTPPQVMRVVLPQEVQVGSHVRAHVEGSDADQDSVEYKFRWWRNNREVSEGKENALELAGFERGDTITVQVTPYDNVGAQGKAALADPITIANSPPKITSTPPTAIAGGRYKYAVTAIDPDGDPLLYSLEKSPSGMKIDKITGRIEWQIPSEVKGTHRARIKVVDSHEGFAFQEFDLIFFPQTTSSNRFSSALLHLVTRF